MNKIVLFIILLISICFAVGKSDAKKESGTSFMDKIKNIVVLMMENRSFDHFLGWLKVN